jgi:uncharacterized membrane protein HdeD (DUF308 family)
VSESWDSVWRVNKNVRVGRGVIGGLLVLVGLIWTLQGLGFLAGSVMTGVMLWAIIGPIVLVVGVLLVAHAVRTHR